MKSRAPNQSAQSLFELIVALGIVALVMVALTRLVTQTIANSTFSRNKNLATRYSQQALEFLRSQRDADWSVFITKTGTYCLNQNPLVNLNNNGACGPSEKIPNTIFTREVNLTYDGASSTMTAVVTTSWPGTSSKVHQSQVTSSFTNWKSP